MKENINKIAVLIPCYNEEATIEKVINDFKRELPEAIIYVYNNNSKDKSYEIAKNAGAVVRNEYRQGKGNVIRSMFEQVEADIYLLVDADDTYPAESAKDLIKAVEDGADMAVGDRLSNGTYLKENKRKFHNLGNSLVKNTINFLFKVDLKDIMSGYRAYSKKFVKNFPILTKEFEIETEMTLHALDKNYIIKEIPIDYRDRPKGSVSKLNTIPDGIKVVRTIGTMFKDYKPLKFFSILAIILLILGLIIGVPVIIEFTKTHYITKVPSAILATGFVMLAFIIEQCGIILHTTVKKNKELYELNMLRYSQIEMLKNEINKRG